MEKFIPKEKLSKKEQKKLNSKARKTWDGVSPVTRNPESKKKYNRKKLQKFDNTDFGAFSFAESQIKIVGRGLAPAK